MRRKINFRRTIFWFYQEVVKPPNNNVWKYRVKSFYNARLSLLYNKTNKYFVILQFHLNLKTILLVKLGKQNIHKSFLDWGYNINKIRLCFYLHFKYWVLHYTFLCPNKKGCQKQQIKAGQTVLYVHTKCMELKSNGPNFLPWKDLANCICWFN